MPHTPLTHVRRMTYCQLRAKKQLITSLPAGLVSSFCANQQLGSHSFLSALINFHLFESPRAITINSLEFEIVSFLCVNLASIGFSRLHYQRGLVVIKSARKKCLIDGPSTKESVETARVPLNPITPSPKSPFRSCR